MTKKSATKALAQGTCGRDAIKCKSNEYPIPAEGKSRPHSGSRASLRKSVVDSRMKHRTWERQGLLRKQVSSDDPCMPVYHNRSGQKRHRLPPSALIPVLDLPKTEGIVSQDFAWAAHGRLAPRTLNVVFASLSHRI